MKILVKGDIKNGISAFTPTVVIARYGYAVDLLSDVGVIAGGSNYAQQMIARGTLSPAQAFMNYGDGTMGMVMGMPVVSVPDYVFETLAAQWLGNNNSLSTNINNDSANLTFLQNTQAFVVSSVATDRGIADEYMRVEQSTEQNKTNLLPDWQWGIEMLYGSGVVPIVSNGTTNPYSATTNTMTVTGFGVVV